MMYLPLKWASHSARLRRSLSVRSVSSSIGASGGVSMSSSNDCLARPREASRPAKLPYGLMGRQKGQAVRSGVAYPSGP